MKNILLVGVVFWLLFLNGYSQVKTWLNNPQLASAPQTVITGAQRAVGSDAQPGQSQVRIIGGSGAHVVSAGPEAAPTTDPPTPAAPVIITATPEPATPTAVVVVPQGMPDTARMPTATALPTVEPPRYPTGDMQYALHHVTDKGYPQACVYIYTKNVRVCWSPGTEPNDAAVRWTVGMVEAGNIAGEPIPQ